jgi:hypothetical protein
VELLEPDAERVARAIVDVSGFDASGFGVSDMILSPSITSPQDPDQARWSAFDVQPSMGTTFGRNTRLDMLWEVYGLATRDGTSRHRVSITMERVTARGLVAASIRVIGGLRNAVTGRQDQSRAISYERVLPGREALAATLRLDLTGSSVGQYRLTLTITDLATGTTTSRSRDLAIVSGR